MVAEPTAADRTMSIQESNLLRSVFRYDPATGHLYKRGQDTPSGRLATKGYRQVFALGKRHMAHRLVWLYFNDEWPPGQLDHINRNKDDNRIENLRVVTNQQNQENVALWSNNRSGFRGVSISASGVFRADIRVDGKTIHLGTFRSAEDAALARMAAEREYYSLLDYSPNYSRNDKLLNLLEVRHRPRAPRRHSE